MLAKLKTMLRTAADSPTKYRQKNNAELKNPESSMLPNAQVKRRL